MPFDRIKQVILSLLNRGGGMVLQFASLWMIAKTIGVTGVGQYAFYTSWMTVLAALAGLGSPTYTLRTVAVLARDKDHRGIRHYIVRMSWSLLGVGALVCVVLAVAAGPVSDWLSVSNAWLHQLFLAGLGSIAFMLMRLMTESLKALNMPNISMGIESIFIPLILILVCATAWLNGWGFEAANIVYLHIASTILATIVMWMLAWRQTRVPVESHQQAWAPKAVFSHSMLPLWGSALLGMLFLNLPIIVLPLFATEEEMGLFSIAYRYINICVSLLMVIAAIYGPRFAREYASRDKKVLSDSLKQTQLLSLALYAPLFLAFTFFPGFVMGLFGSEFTSGGALLVSMAIGQLLYASTGLVGLMMNMIHREKVEFWISLIATVVMCLLIMVLGHLYSVLGVAIAFGIGLGMKNLASWFAVRHYLDMIAKDNSARVANS